MKIFIFNIIMLLCINSHAQQIDQKQLIGTWISVETKWVASNYTFNNNTEWTFTLAQKLITKNTIENVGVIENWFDYKIVGNELITTSANGTKNYSTIIELNATKLVTRFVDGSGGDEVVLTTYRKKT